MIELLNFLRCSFKPGLGLKGIGAAVLAVACLFQPAMAQQFQPKANDLVVRAGAAALFFDSSASLTLAGAPLPAAGIHVSNNFTASLELDYYFMPNISASLTLGVPPVTHVNGTGILAPVGWLANVQYGLGAFLIKYHFTNWARFQPFVGAGLAYFKVLKAHGVAITNLEIDDRFGAALQIGADYMLTPRIGLFVSVSHVFLSTQGKGTFMALPIAANVALDPTIFQSGIAVRF
jgi:outer membrane protein W